MRHTTTFLIFFTAMAICALQAVAQGVRELPLPQVPSSLTVPVQRADYILEHFWDAMDWSDTALSRDTAFMEQHIANYFSVAPHASPKGTKRAMEGVVSHAATDSLTLHLITTLTHRYLGEPESPVYDDAAYEQMCRALSVAYPPESRQGIHIAYQLECLGKNHPGIPAADFTFIDRDGIHHQLLKTLQPQARTILVFFDPDCTDCHSLADTMRNDADINLQVSAGTLQVVFITPFDTDLTLWKSYADTLPHQWIVGYSPKGRIETDKLYHLPVIPAIYLLEPGAIVARRNAPTYRFE